MIDSRQVEGDLVNLVGLLQGCDIPIPWGAAHLDSVRQKPGALPGRMFG